MNTLLSITSRFNSLFIVLFGLGIVIVFCLIWAHQRINSIQYEARTRVGIVIVVVLTIGAVVLLSHYQTWGFVLLAIGSLVIMNYLCAYDKALSRYGDALLAIVLIFAASGRFWPQDLRGDNYENVIMLTRDLTYILNGILFLFYIKRQIIALKLSLMFFLLAAFGITYVYMSITTGYPRHQLFILTESAKGATMFITSLVLTIVYVVHYHRKAQIMRVNDL
jgi:hypothetical protein